VRWVMKDPDEVHTMTFPGTGGVPAFIVPEPQPQGPAVGTEVGMITADGHLRSSTTRVLVRLLPLDTQRAISMGAEGDPKEDAETALGLATGRRAPRRSRSQGK